VATKRQKVEVGIFLVVAGAILVAVLVALMGIHRTTLTTYHIEFRENVAGLAEGSRVTYQGVPVGKITGVVITDDNRIRVAVGVDAHTIRLRKDVQAKLTMESVFGPIAIDLFYPAADTQQPLLAPGALIPVESSLREHIEQDIPKTLEKLVSVMTRIDATLAAIEPEDVATTIDSLSSVIAQLDAALAKVKPADVKKAVERFDTLLKSTDATLAELRKQTGAIATSLQDLTKQVGTDLTATRGRIGKSLDQFATATDETVKLVKSVHRVVEQNRETVAASLTHLKAVLAKADKQLGGLDLPRSEKALRAAADKVGSAATSIGDAAKTMSRGRDDLRRSLDNVERSVTRTLDELERTLRSARRLIDYLERDPAALIRGKEAEKKR